MDLWQGSELISVAKSNLQKSSISDVWQGFDFVLVATNDFCKKKSSQMFGKVLNTLLQIMLKWTLDDYQLEVLAR